MNGVRRPRTRRGLALVVAAFALLLGGCVYLRLLELKLQLGKFDRFFSLQTEDGITLICHQPVLRTDDLRWIGVKPEWTKTLGQAEQWQVRWAKQMPEGVTETAPFDIVLEFTFAEQKLTRATIPERYFSVMPKSFLIGIVKSVGAGKVDKTGKRLESVVSAAEVAAARPKLPAIDKLLGVPSKEWVEGNTTIVSYRYIPATREPQPGVFDMRLTFDTPSGEMLKWQGITPVGRIAFDFSSDRAKR